MSYCLNPICQEPQNPDSHQICRSCGSNLRLQGRYRSLKLLGRGGFGRTFLAVDERQSPQLVCVIKQLLPQQKYFAGTFQDARERFEQEAFCLKELGQHPQIPALLAAFEQEQYFYLVQEFIKGADLATLVEEEGTFSATQIWQLLDDLLPVLKLIHDRQIIHRDIKPANIIRRRQDHRCVLVDFGAAKQVTSLNLFTTGTSIGSPEYVAPEQARGQATYASDLYSLGATCLYLLTGISPFSLFDVANDRWAWREYLTPSAVDSVAEHRLYPILDKLVQPAVNYRFQSVDELIQAVQPQPLTLPSRSLPIQQDVVPCPWQCLHTLTGHTNSVHTVAISPDSQMLASAGADPTIRLWHLATGAEIDTLSGHSSCVNSVAFSPKQPILASCGDDRTIKLWDLDTQQVIHMFLGHAHAIKAIAFSLDGKILASGSWDKTIKLWNVETGEELCTLAGHRLQITSVAFSPDGQQLASASYDRTVQVWHLYFPNQTEMKPKLRHTFSDHLWPTFAVAFSWDGEILATGSDDKTIQLRHLKTGKILQAIAEHSWSVVALAFSPDRETLISGSWDQTVKLWHLSSGQAIATLSGHSDSVYAVAISSNGQMIASGSKDKTVKIWVQSSLRGQ